MSPVKPKELRQLVPESDASLCAVLVAFLKWMLLVTRWFNYAFDSNGAFTTQFRNDLCADLMAGGGCHSNNNAD